MSSHNRKLVRNRQVLIFAIASIVALLTSYFIEYLLEIKPCVLCSYQRYLYWSAVVLVSLFYYRNKYIFLLGIWLIYFINTGLSAYHLGVELKLFELPQVCQADYGKISHGDWEGLYEQTIAGPAPSCDNPTYIFKGLSLTAVNFIYLVTVLFFIFFTIKNDTRKKKTNY